MAEIPIVMQAWRAFLEAHVRLVARVEADLEGACGLSLPWYDVLFQLSVADGGRLRMSELAERVLLSRSGLTRLVDRIVDAGLVSRAAVPGDRRSLYVEISSEGRALVRRARGVVRQSVGEHFGSAFTDHELARLRDDLSRVPVARSPGRAARTAG